MTQLQRVARDPAPADHLDRLIAKYGERVPRYMIPDRIAIGTTLPINSNGKIDRRTIFSNLS